MSRLPLSAFEAVFGEADVAPTSGVAGLSSGLTTIYISTQSQFTQGA